MDVLGGLGGNVTSSATLLDDPERFVCCMYGKAQFSSINKLRYVSFSQKYQGISGQVLSAFAGMDLGLLPRCKEQTSKRIYGVMHTQTVFKPTKPLWSWLEN